MNKNPPKLDLNLILLRILVTLAAIFVIIFTYNTAFKFRMPEKSALNKSPQPAPPVIDYKLAPKYYGKFAVVEGVVVGTYKTNKACFLNFHPDYKRYFTAVIFASSFSKFASSPDVYYKNKKVRVKGTIKEYRGKPEIIINTPSQIEIIE
ncbi:MAG: hypothetical protein KKB82_04190 [Candidatus Omnitrophica bacterium]|nr:hypothetical protein [Candidatus Omnitrophota bacterium]MBU1925105.1 hypothetical protein [Candidatus Omnitrophota bacterium]